MRKVYVEAKVKLILVLDDDASLDEVLSEMGYDFEDTTTKATIEDTELMEWEVKDSK